MIKLTLSGLVCAAAIACVPQSQPTVSAPGGQQSGDQQTRKSASSTAANESSTPVADPNATPVDTGVPVVPANVVLPTETTVQQRYPNWVDPSQSEMDNPANAKIYNYTNDGINNVNGQALPQTVPPGKVALVKKRSQDIDENTGMYRVTVTTDTGKTGTGNFDTANVNMGNWRASVTDTGAGLNIQENAGGGGDDGGGGGDNDNFDRN